MKRENIDPKRLDEHSPHPEATVVVGTYVASNGMQIPIELRMNKYSLIYRLWCEERDRRGGEQITDFPFLTDEALALQDEIKEIDV